MSQKNKIRNLLEEDRFLLIILDACRYDTMADNVDKEVEKVLSPAVNTHEWMRRIWSGEYNITYISPSPFCSSEEVHGYIGSEHFKEIIEVWREGWDEDNGTVQPETIKEYAIRYSDRDRIICHFIQPHMPHIHPDKRLSPSEYGGNNLQKIGEEISDEHIKESYLYNFLWVWNKGVEGIINNIENRKTIVTSDHGESLGERGNYGHNINCPEVREVPWLEIQ